VTGPDVYAALTTAPLDVVALQRRVEHAGAGATSVFVGNVRETHEGREVLRIDYEAYEAMAAEVLRAVADEVAGRYAGTRIAVEHRLGTLGVGEASVVIAVSHAHRGSAIEACTAMIETLKQRVPIWKREHFADGTTSWVDPTGAADAPGGAAGPGR
jgi:molybdopterin synthase catalytic subunit